MIITQQQKRQLAARATKLHPIILIGNKGLTESVQLEIDHALNHHELIKIRFHDKDKTQQGQMLDVICQQHAAILINRIGHVIVIYRERIEQKKTK